MANAIATCAGAVLGTSTVTPYIQAPQELRRRTGLTSVVTAGLFLLSLFRCPIAVVIPGYAIAPAIIMGGIFKIRAPRDLDFETWTEIVLAVGTVLIMTFSDSIAEGIVWGISSCTAIKTGRGKSGASV